MARVAFLRWPIMRRVERSACREFGPRCTCMARVLALVLQQALVPDLCGCGAKRLGRHLCGHGRGAQAAPLWRAALLALLL